MACNGNCNGAQEGCGCDCTSSNAAFGATGKREVAEEAGGGFYVLDGSLEAVIPGWSDRGESLPANVQALLTGGEGLVTEEDPAGLLRDVEEFALAPDVDASYGTSKPSMTVLYTAMPPTGAAQLSLTENTTAAMICYQMCFAITFKCRISVYYEDLPLVPKGMARLASGGKSDKACHLFAIVEDCDGKRRRIELTPNWPPDEAGLENEERAALREDGKEAPELRRIGGNDKEQDEKERNENYSMIMENAKAPPGIGAPPPPNEVTECKIELDCPVCEMCGKPENECCTLLQDGYMGLYGWKNRRQYKPFEGPNSNTFIKKLLEQCGMSCELPPCALGADAHADKDFRGRPK
jgi:hypothetical protein